MPPVTRIMRFMPPSMMKALRSLGLSLIAQESFVERFDRFVAHGLGTERTHDFGSSLDIAHATSPSSIAAEGTASAGYSSRQLGFIGNQPLMTR